MHVEHHHWTNPKGVCQHLSGLIIVESNLLLPNNPVSIYKVAIKRPLRSTSSSKAEADIEGKAFIERKGMSLVGVLDFGAELTIRGQASADNYSSTEIRLEQCLLLTSIHPDTRTRQLRLTLVQPTGLYSKTCFTKNYLPPLLKLPPPAFFSSSRAQGHEKTNTAEQRDWRDVLSGSSARQLRIHCTHRVARKHAN